MSSRVGFIGLGAMGLPMTRNLAASGRTLLVYDSSEATCKRAEAIHGVEVAESLASAAGGAEVLFTCVPNDPVLREVYLGEGGVVQSIAPGAVTVDCSTVSPGVTRDIAGALAQSGVAHLDASMLGSVAQAESGEIGFVVGGDRGAFERVGPLLDVLGRFRKYAGSSGSGNRVKLIHQALVAANAVAVGEAMALCEATGTDLDCFYDVVCNGGGFAYSRYLEKRMPRMRAGDFSALFTLEFMLKDAALGHDLAKAAGLDTPLLARVRALFEKAKDAGLGLDDFSAVARLYDAGVGGPARNGAER